MRALRSVYGKDITVDHLKTFGEPGLQALAASVVDEQAQQQTSSATNSDAQPQTSVDNNSSSSLKSKVSSMPVTIRVPHHQTEFELDSWHLGDSLLQAAQDYPELMSEYMEGTCGGTMSCCTCHVYLEQQHDYQQSLLPLSDVSEAEQDMLDLAHEPRDGSSRLACQVVLTRNLLDQYVNDDENNSCNTSNKLVVTIPSGVNDVWK